MIDCSKKEKKKTLKNERKKNKKPPHCTKTMIMTMTPKKYILAISVVIGLTGN